MLPKINDEQLHVRGEHANLQYRINDVLLPEGLTGFGEELDTRFVDNVSLIDGSLASPIWFSYGRYCGYPY